MCNQSRQRVGGLSISSLQCCEAGESCESGLSWYIFSVEMKKKSSTFIAAELSNVNYDVIMKYMTFSTDVLICSKRF